MKYRIEPNVGSWYKDADLEQLFEVVAMDMSEGYVDIQYFAGEIDEIELDLWYELDLTTMPQPDDCSGPFELTKEELGFYDAIIYPEDWSGILSGLEPEESY